jgi:arylsulfatase A
MTHRWLVALSMLVVAIGAGALRAQPADRPPNVVFIMADDLGYREVGCFGQEKILTPNIDRLAAEGMRLTRHYAGSAVCAPTRAVLMTGKHTGHSPIRGNKEAGGWGPEEPEGQHPLPGPEVTLAEMFRARGYATGAFGKWGLGGPGSEGHPSFQGFDHFYGYLCQRVAHNYYPTHLWRNHDVDVLHNNRYFSAHQKLAEPLESEAAYDERFAGGDYAPEEIITELLGWVRERHEQRPDQPIFVYYPTIIPHLALQAPREWVDRYPREWDTGPYLGDQGYLPNPRPRAAYAAMISSMDHDVGRILDLLDELGLAENTIVVFTSDNGASYVGGVDREFFGSHGELRGHKGQLWEGGIRVPTVVRWPGVVGPGTESAAPSYHPDWLPTLAAAAGGAAPEGVDGLSLLPMLRGEVGRVDREFLYWEFPEGAQQQAMVFGASGRWKLLRPALRSEPDRVELYDLLDDPGETTNLAETHPDLVAQGLETMRSQHLNSALFPIAALDR